MEAYLACSSSCCTVASMYQWRAVPDGMTITVGPTIPVVSSIKSELCDNQHYMDHFLLKEEAAKQAYVQSADMWVYFPVHWEGMLLLLSDRHGNKNALLHTIIQLSFPSLLIMAILIILLLYISVITCNVLCETDDLNVRWLIVLGTHVTRELCCCWSNVLLKALLVLSLINY